MCTRAIHFPLPPFARFFPSLFLSFFFLLRESIFFSHSEKEGGGGTLQDVESLTRSAGMVVNPIRDRETRILN